MGMTKHEAQAAFDQVRELAVGLPISPDATAAHAMVESGYLRSGLAVQHKNIWGVKAGVGWSGATITLPTKEEVNGQLVDTVARFRSYDGWHQAVVDYADLVQRLYPFAYRHSGNPVAFLAGLFLTGPYKWATDSGAFLKALNVLATYGRISEADSLRLGEHALWVDNSPTLAKGMNTIAAALTRRPAVHSERVLVTRTRRLDGTFKLDLRQVEEVGAM